MRKAINYSIPNVSNEIYGQLTDGRLSAYSAGRLARAFGLLSNKKSIHGRIDIISYSDSTIASDIIRKMKNIFFHMTITKLFIYFAAITFFLVFKSVAVAKPNLYIPPLKIQKGQSLEIPVKIDHVEKLAGIKLVIEYELKHFMYEKVDKSETTSGLMHVVNDKNPGKLIIVMAGAKGISGNDFNIITIQFKVVSEIKETAPGNIRITEAELVSEDLKEIQCLIEERSSIILPNR